MARTILLALSAALVALNTNADGMRFELRVFPRISMADPSKAVYLLAEIKGDECEAWYCPAHELWINDVRIERHESDCPPWDERQEFPRRRLYHIARTRGQYTAEVRLFKAGHELARASASWEVH